MQQITNKEYPEIKPLDIKLKKKTANGKHQEMINNVLEFMNENLKDKRIYGKWCGKLKKYKPNQIHDAIKLSKSKSNPQKYFNAILKNKWL